MMKAKMLLISCIFASTLTIAAVAFAVPIQLNEVGVNSSAVVRATFPEIGGPYNVLAGLYQLEIQGRGTFDGFCVDPAWAPTQFSSYDLRAIPEDSPYARAAYLLSLRSEAGFNAAAAQLAVWRIMMGDDFQIVGTLPHLTTYYLSLAIPSTFDLSRYSFAASPGDGPSFGRVFQDYVVATPAPSTPEPSTMLLFGSGLVGLIFRMKARIRS